MGSPLWVFATLYLSFKFVVVRSFTFPCNERPVYQTFINVHDDDTYDWFLLSRRKSLSRTIPFIVSGCIVNSVPSLTFAGTSFKEDESMFGIGNDEVSSLVYKEMLGAGSFKTVYMVEGKLGKKYALSVQKLRGKDDVRDALQGIQISDYLQEEMKKTGENGNLFEKILAWWIQPTALSDFGSDKSVFPNTLSLTQRTHKVPKKFLGSKWLVALKPLYDIDLKHFSQKFPQRYPVGTQFVPNAPRGYALTIALHLCHAGRLMHKAGVVHRDIKPKNIMLSNGIPVIIDFGFSRVVNNIGKDGRICVSEPGRVRGEASYVLATDVKESKGCQEGDCYAMGKSLYEFIFGQALNGSSSKVSITVEEAEHRNSMFLSLLEDHHSVQSSRFMLSEGERLLLLEVIRGLCKKTSPLSFREAEMILCNGMGKIQY
jgi:serine/threonine protein kinase